MQNIQSHDLTDTMILRFLNLFVVRNFLRFLKIELQLNQLKTSLPTLSSRWRQSTSMVDLMEEELKIWKWL